MRISIALSAAADLGIARRVVLPFPPERFRRTSVVDRPGDWGPEFDRVVGALQATGDLIVLDARLDDLDAYRAVNARILDEAQDLARRMDARAVAMIVWEGRSRDGDDVTGVFGDAAQARGLSVIEVPTT